MLAPVSTELVSRDLVHTELDLGAQVYVGWRWCLGCRYVHVSCGTGAWVSRDRHRDSGPVAERDAAVAGSLGCQSAVVPSDPTAAGPPLWMVSHKPTLPQQCWVKSQL